MAHKHTRDKAKRERAKLRNPRGSKKGGKKTRYRRNCKRERKFNSKI